ncbi:hypothetical protein [Streptomyces sp. HUAS TT7]|uniref:hypothetical protein n=1 Tax=Streptomyces sp. HUAS TT7 TaxID=3447507 RepID=UPI003F658A73
MAPARPGIGQSQLPSGPEAGPSGTPTPTALPLGSRSGSPTSAVDLDAEADADLGLAPLLAGHIDAISDQADRLHVLELLRTARITISDRAEDADDVFDPSLARYRDKCRPATTYTDQGRLHYDLVLDLAEQLRAHFADED